MIRTPEASEVGELNSRYRLADWLYSVSMHSQISGKQYLRNAEYLDTVPLVSDYFRLLCARN